MSIPVDHTGEGIDLSQSTAASNWTITVSDIRTVKVSNISLAASARDIKEFFSFSGDVRYVEMQRETESTQQAYVTFKETQGADTAALLSGSTLAGLPITITPVGNYQLPPDAPSTPVKQETSTGSAFHKAEDVVSTMLAKGFIMGKDAINKAKAFDERHQFTSNASAKVTSIDRRIGFSERLSIGTAIVGEKVREMDERYQVSGKTKSAFGFAGQKASSAGSSLMSNQYVISGASWFSNAYSAAAKAAGDLSSMTKQKVEKAEEEKGGSIDYFSYSHLDNSPHGEAPTVAVNSVDDDKLGII